MRNIKFLRAVSQLMMFIKRDFDILCPEEQLCGKQKRHQLNILPFLSLLVKSLAIDPITRKLNHEKLALRTAYLDNLVTVFHPLHCEKEKPE